MLWGVGGTGVIVFIAAHWRSFEITIYAFLMSSPNLREGSLDLGSRIMASISVAAWQRYVSSVAIGKGMEVGENVTLSVFTGEHVDDTINL